MRSGLMTSTLPEAPSAPLNPETLNRGSQDRDQPRGHGGRGEVIRTEGLIEERADSLQGIEGSSILRRTVVHFC